MDNATFGKALTVAVWLAFAIIIIEMVAGAFLTVRPMPVKCIRQGLLHKGPVYPQIGGLPPLTSPVNPVS